MKDRARLGSEKLLCTREWGTCSHLEQAGKSGDTHNWLDQAEPANHPSQRQHEEVSCLVQAPSWVLWRSPYMASAPKKGLSCPQPLLCQRRPQAVALGLQAAPRCWEPAGQEIQGVQKALLPGAGSRCPPWHRDASLGSQRCPSLHVGAWV